MLYKELISLHGYFDARYERVRHEGHARDFAVLQAVGVNRGSEAGRAIHEGARRGPSGEEKKQPWRQRPQNVQKKGYFAQIENNMMSAKSSF